MTVSHGAGLALLIAPLTVALYRSYKAGALKHILLGAGGALVVALWVFAIAYLLSH